MRFITGKLLILSFLAVQLIATFPAFAQQGIPANLPVGGKSLVLNGSGERTKFVVTLYRAGLYLAEKSQDANTILTSDKEMAIRLQILSGFISSEKMTQATNQGFHNSTGGKTAPIQSKIQQFLAAFKSPIKKGDLFEFSYTPAGGTKISKNGKSISVIKGLPFKQALFGIWLSDRPAQMSLKNQMLGYQSK